MKGAIITHRGLESVSAIEVDEIIGKKAKIGESAAIFDIKNLQELAKVCYFSQSAKRVVLFLGSFDVSDLKSAVSRIKSILESTDFFSKDFQSIIKKSHKVECERFGEHNFNSMEIEEETGKALKKIVGLKTDYKNPFFTIYVYIKEDKGHLGIDFSGKDLSKRKYKIFNYGGCIKGTVAYGLLRLAGFKKGSFVVDPFCGTGTIPIEAFLFEKEFSPHYYHRDFIFKNYLEFDFEKFDKTPDKSKLVYGLDSKQKYVSAAKKNSKIAGADFQITKADVEWLDTKFEKESVDCIVTKPLIPSKVVSEKIAEKIYKDLFHNAHFILKKTGKIGVLTQKPGLIIETAEKYNFHIEKKIIVESGHLIYETIVFKK